MNEIAETKYIERKIYNIRGVEVMLNLDLAEQYQCANGTKSINLAVKRNKDRFPSDFYFQLNEEEYNQICGFNLKLQNNKKSKISIYKEEEIKTADKNLKKILKLRTKSVLNQINEIEEKISSNIDIQSVGNIYK